MEIYRILLHINFLPFLLLLDRLKDVPYLTVDLLYPFSTTIILFTHVPLSPRSLLVSILLRRNVVVRKVLVVQIVQGRGRSAFD